MSSTPNNQQCASNDAINCSTDTSVRAASRKNRVFVFRDFLWETYGNPSTAGGSSYLKPGDRILDVAGGKGDLSWLFLNVDGLSSVVVDPRSLSSTNHMIRSVHWLEEHPEEARERAIPNLPTHQPLAALMPQILERKEKRPSGDDPEYLEPQHLKIKLNKELVGALREAMADEESIASEGCPHSWRRFWDQAKEASSANQVDSGNDCFLPASEQRKSTVTEPISAALEAWQVFQSIRLIVGFHPDQATEPCVDLAEVLRVPLCIVPCCVFPSEFPDRKVAVQQESGEVIMTRVRDYQLFLQYLQHKQPKLRNATIPFHYTGTPLKNVALFMLPEDN